MIQDTITVMYTCNECGIKDRKIVMPVRGETEPVGFWMRNIAGGRISFDHKNHSPNCKAKSMTNLKIPINMREDAPIGSKVT